MMTKLHRAAKSSISMNKRLYHQIPILSNNTNIDTFEIVVPPLSYSFESFDSNEIRTHLLNRRIITNKSDNPSDILQRTIHNICNIELKNKNRWNLSSSSINNFHHDLSYAIESKLLAFGTPLITNLGQTMNPSLAPIACTVINLPKKHKISDLTDHILPSAAKGQGLGFDLTQFDDPVSMLHTLNDIFLNIDKQCARTVAGMASLHSSHPQIIPFIKCKKNANFNNGRFNISIKVQNEEIEQNEEVLQHIAESIHYCGEPGVLFVDQLENDNPLPHMPYVSTAPCAELAMSQGDGCHFGYINIANYVHQERVNNPMFNALDKIDWCLLEKVIQITTRVLDNAVEISSDLGHNSVSTKRRIGVGICGFSDLLLSMNIPYDSTAAMILSSEIMNFINFVSKMSSIELSANRGAFDCYKESKYYTDEEWLNRNRWKHVENQKISDIEWNQYYTQIKKYGIRNATTTALPPSGNSSLIINASQSIEPYFNLLNPWNRATVSPKVEAFLQKQSIFRKDINMEQIKNIILNHNGILPSISECKHKGIHIPPHIHSILKCATQISPQSHIDIVSAFQKHLDDSVSKTVNLPNKADCAYIVDLMIKCYNDGLKGITFFRDGCLAER